MRRLFPVLLCTLLLWSGAVLADDPPSGGQGCGLAAGGLVNQGQNGVTVINCAGVSEAYAGQLAGVLTYILQHRLDPEIVIAKLSEVEGGPEGDAPRTLSPEQGQTIVKQLVGKPGEKIAIVASPAGKDAGDYALAIATKLQMAGWQVEGSQIRRVVPAGFDDLPGLVMVVHDEKAPPEKAKRLKAALASAKLYLPIVADPTLPADGAMLWVGKRPGAGPTQ
jgi:hypothetical protein